MSKHILIIDDHHLIRKIVKGVLVEWHPSLTITEAENGQDALEKVDAANEDYDLVLCDINMPVMNGLAFLEEKNKHPKLKNTPVIIISSEASDNLIEEYKDKGISYWLQKPFDKLQLQNALQHIAV